MSTTNNILKNNFKLRLKFFFVTNFRPLVLKNANTRIRFLRLFFLFLFFLIFFVKNKNSRIYLKKKTTLFKKIINNKTYLLTNNENILINQNCGVIPKKQKKILLDTKFKKYQINITESFIDKIRNKKDFKINFIIFTKSYAHFVLLRAPFRDKISKNILQHQRFYIYLNFFSSKYVPSLFSNKLYLF